MTALRILNVVVWGALFLYMIPGAWSASFGRNPRHGDPMRLAVQATAFVMICGSLRWLFIPHSMSALAAIHVLAAVDAVYIALLARSYGRGQPL